MRFSSINGQTKPPERFWRAEGLFGPPEHPSAQIGQSFSFALVPAAQGFLV
jgi:hypothetical protein